MLPYKGSLRDITCDSKAITFCLDVFMTQQRAWECGGQGPGELKGRVLRDKRKQDDALIQQNTQDDQQSSVPAAAQASVQGTDKSI